MLPDKAFEEYDILDAIDLAIIVMEVGEDGLPRYVAMNKKSRDFTSLTHEDIYGKTALEIFGGATGERALNRHLEALSKAEATTYDISLPSIQKTTYLRTRLQPVFDKAGKVTHLIGSSTDVTSERERDTALELSKLAQEKAEEASKAKERFLANMSHEIRTPMNGILGMCELLAETALDDQQALFANTIFNSASALLSLVNDVLDFSKIQANKISIQDAPFSMRALVSDLDTLLTAKAEFKGLRLEIDYAATLPSNFVGDNNKIRQILLNLIGNAIKFTEIGHVSLTITYEPDYPDYPLQLVVADTGPGIPLDQQDKVFSAFEQADHTAVRETEGTGLGLAITQALVERMGGRISLSSEPDNGSTFSVYLNLPSTDTAPQALKPTALSPSPAAPAISSRAAPASKVSTEEAWLSGFKILIAEDNQTNQLVANRMLSPTGATLVFAENGVKALEQFKEFDPDLVLMDLSMPVLGGLEATRLIRQFENETKKSACRIVALTANAQPSDVEACLSVGMDDFLSKPFRKSDLLSMVRPEHPSLPDTALPPQ